jgi:hypothetical protein
LLGYDPLEQSDPFTVIGSTFTTWPPPAVTVTGVEPEMLPGIGWVTGITAIMVDVPAAMGVTNPALLIVAMDVSEELHAADKVRFWVELSVYVPVAVNCWVVPSAMLVLSGRTIIAMRVAGVTVRVVAGAEIVPDTAVIAVLPTATEVALPVLPAALLIVATVVLDEPQVTDEVTSLVILSEYVPTAVNS